MKVVISGYYGFDNVGDDAILLSIVQALKACDEQIKITVLSNQPESTKLQYHVDAINRWSFKEVYQALKEADGLISGGGSLLQDETGIKSIIYYTGIMKIAQFLKVPVFIYAQGMGPIHRTFGKRMVKHALKKTSITVRDNESKQLLEAIGVKKEVEIVPDPVLGLKLAHQEVAWWSEQSFSGPVVTVSVRDWPSAVPFKEKIAQGLDQMVQKGAQVVFIPMHGKHDYEASIEVAGLMKEKSSIAPFDASIEEKIMMIGTSDLLVGMRLHALIFAALTNTPFVALSYDPKIDSFASISKQPIGGHVTKEDWTGESLVGQLSQLLENLDREKQSLQRIMEPLQKQANETAEKALAFFNGAK